MVNNIHEIINIGINAYIESGYSKSYIYGFKTFGKALNAFLEDNNIDYSHDIASKWVNSEDFKLQMSGAKRYNDIINEIHTSGRSNLIIDSKDRFCYDSLNSEHKNLVNKYISTINKKYSRINLLKSSCSRFLWHLEKLNVKLLSEISIKDIENYKINYIYKMKQRNFLDIANFVKYLNELMIIDKDKSIKLIDNLLGINNKTIILTSDEIHDLNELVATNNSDLSRQIFIEFSNKYLDYLKEHNYKDNIFNIAIKTINEYDEFVIKNNILYSTDSMEYWLNINKSIWTNVNYQGTRRVLLSISDLIDGKSIKLQYPVQKEEVGPKWCHIELNEYLKSRKYENLAPSTISMIKNSCKRFFNFLKENNINNWQDIVVEDIKKFMNNDTHSTVAGRNAYFVRIKKFLEYLSNKGVANIILSNSISTRVSKKTTIIDILPNEDIDIIYKYRSEAKSPNELRNIAIVILGLTTGLRGSDIIKIKLNDISFNNKTIRIIQQKTQRSLILPLTVDCENSILTFIKNGRPRNQKSDFLFLSSKAPYCQLSRSACSMALKKVLKRKKCAYFHILRKTFASRLLQTGNKPREIAATLGHKDLTSLDVYISTDSNRMRLCALSLKGIEYKGKFDL